MPRAKRGFKARRRRNRLLKWAKGFRGKRKNCHAIANESVQLELKGKTPRTVAVPLALIRKAHLVVEF